MKEFFEKLGAKEKYMIIIMFMIFGIHGLYVLSIGSIIPMMREEFNISYGVGGWIVSAQNIGNALGGLFAGLLAITIGMKVSFVLFNVVCLTGFILALLTKNPYLLILAFLLVGIGRGVTNNYDNLAVTSLGKGSSAPINMLHSCFAIGALTAPLLVMVYTKDDITGWRMPVIIIIACVAITTILSLKINMDRISYDKGDEHADRGFGFFKDRNFMIPAASMFMYQCVEATLMGWIVSYFIDRGIVSAESTQLFSSVLWVFILIGRLVCVFLAKKVSSPLFVKVLSIGMLVFVIVMLTAQSFAIAVIGVIGLGLACSGMYGAITACAGEVIPKYAHAMSAFIAIAGAGASLWPMIVGYLADGLGMQTAMASVLVPDIIMIILAFVFDRKKRS